MVSIMASALPTGRLSECVCLKATHLFHSISVPSQEVIQAPSVPKSVVSFPPVQVNLESASMGQPHPGFQCNIQRWSWTGIFPSR